MKITRNNYEILAIDFLEGKLTPTDAAAFKAFLEKNADIAAEIERIRNISIASLHEQPKLNFSFLKQNINDLEINPANFEEFCIAFHENDLTENNRQKLIAFIGTDARLQKKFDLFQRVKIIPDKSIKYFNKTGLKHKEASTINFRRIVLISSFAAAASLATLFMLRLPSESKENTQLVRSESLETIPAQTISNEKNSVEIEPRKSNVQERASVLKSTKRNINETTVIAVVDTANTEDADIRISMIEPALIENTLNYADISVTIKPYKGYTVEQPATGIDIIKETGTNLYSRATRITAAEIIQTGIKGINSMVESDLKFEAQSDDKGRMTAFALSSESFNFKRKVGSN